MPPAGSPASIHDSELVLAQDTTNSNNNKFCAKDNIVDVVDNVVEEDRGQCNQFG